MPLTLTLSLHLRQAIRGENYVQVTGKKEALQKGVALLKEVLEGNAKDAVKVQSPGLGRFLIAGGGGPLGYHACPPSPTSQFGASPAPSCWGIALRPPRGILVTADLPACLFGSEPRSPVGPHKAMPGTPPPLLRGVNTYPARTPQSEGYTSFWGGGTWARLRLCLRYRDFDPRTYRIGHLLFVVGLTPPGGRMHAGQVFPLEDPARPQRLRTTSSTSVGSRSCGRRMS